MNTTNELYDMSPVELAREYDKRFIQGKTEQLHSLPTESNNPTNPNNNMNLYHAVLTRQLHKLNPVVTEVPYQKSTEPINNPIKSHSCINNPINTHIKEKVLSYLEDKLVSPIDILNNLYQTKRQILKNKLEDYAFFAITLSMTICLSIALVKSFIKYYTHSA